ncbi:MAG TPA: hypothetical protein VNO30_08810 [Kofleriaceae bacterium]|nr:hypothetical protein [Kofleriaceae bacterium]
MAGDDDLRLNTLHRFAKHSPRLVLHEYAHCEIPAGCGGMVMRWYDPASGAPALVRVSAHDAAATCWLDGEPLSSSIAQLRAGPHSLAVHLRRERPGVQPFVIGAMYEADEDTDVISPGASRWRCTDVAPPEGWTAPGFDDAAWRDVPRLPAGRLAELEQWQRYTFDEAAGHGRPVFALETEELWLRVAFVAPAAPQGGSR